MFNVPTPFKSVCDATESCNVNAVNVIPFFVVEDTPTPAAIRGSDAPIPIVKFSEVVAPAVLVVV